MWGKVRKFGAHRFCDDLIFIKDYIPFITTFDLYRCFDLGVEAGSENRAKSRPQRRKADTKLMSRRARREKSC